MAAAAEAAARNSRRAEGWMSWPGSLTGFALYRSRRRTVDWFRSPKCDRTVDRRSAHRSSVPPWRSGPPLLPRDSDRSCFRQAGSWSVACLLVARPFSNRLFQQRDRAVEVLHEAACRRTRWALRPIHVARLLAQSSGDFPEADAAGSAPSVRDGDHPGIAAAGGGPERSAAVAVRGIVCPRARLEQSLGDIRREVCGPVIAVNRCRSWREGSLRHRAARAPPPPTAPS